jgi:hypothetical protein
MFRSLKQTPVLAAEGAIVPLDKDAVPSNGCPNPKAVELLVIVGKDGCFDFVENSRDDVDSKANANFRRVTTIRYEQSKGRVSFKGAGKDWTIRFISYSSDPSSIRTSINGTPSSKSQVVVSMNGYIRGTVVSIPASNPGDAVTIELGPNPQLDIINHTDAIHALVLDFQMEFPAKDRIWEVIQGKQPSSTKVARLLALGLNELLVGPILELLLADSR